MRILLSGLSGLVSCCLFLLALGLSGCNSSNGAPTTSASEVSPRVPGAPPAGAHCTVQFRRDMLGSHSDLPISPLTDGINGANVSVSGRLLRTDDQWIVLARKHHETGAEYELWIPRDNVLLLQIAR